MRAGQRLASDRLKWRSWRGSVVRWFLSAALMLMAVSAPWRKYPIYRQHSTQVARALGWLLTLRWFRTKAVCICTCTVFL